MEIPLYSKYFCILLFSAFLITHSTWAYSRCLDDQKTLLLELRRELTFDSSLSTKLVTWNYTENCCLWIGVECDGEGHVISLQLDQETISGAIKESSILFYFRHLRRLNLAYNNFNCQIPSAIHNLTHLSHLNLSNAGFFGQVPLGLSLMTSLVSLDLSSGELQIPNLKIILQNLSGLKELYLDGANISVVGGNWGYIISSTLPNLQILSLRGCGLSGPLHPSLVHLRSLSIIRLNDNNLSTTIPDFFANFSNLTTLILNNCSLIGSFPGTIFQAPTLKVLDLSWNQNLSGTLPDFPNRSSLRSIDLKDSNFSGLLKPLANLTKLFYLDLSENSFSGSIWSLFMLKKLTHVDLSHNLLSGTIPPSLFCAPSLKFLDLASNSFYGRINEFSTLYSSKLEWINLRNNRLDGPIPMSLFKLKRLQRLDLSENIFDSSNINSSLPAFTKLTFLSISSCNLHNFPNLRNHSLSSLDLSHNHIAGEIPGWIWDGPLYDLDLSFNLLVGLQKPYRFPHSLNELYLYSNKLRGSIPTRLCNITDLGGLDLSNNSLRGSIPPCFCNITYLTLLDLSNNSLSGSIPPCLLKHHSLMTLNLGTNKINGEIPDTFSSTECNLGVLDLKQNNLEGKIPPSLANCKSLEVINVGNNKIEDKFPCMLPSSLRVLVMHFNKFHGEVRCYKSWPKLQVIDVASNNLSGNLHSMNFSSWTRMLQDNHSTFYAYYKVILTSKGLELEYGERILMMFMTVDFSCNNFQGMIPDVVGDLKSLYSLNLSYNALTGTIPKSFGKLNHLESLDLSLNLPTGKIPIELASLTSLEVLNLSYNKLVGAIPLGRQFQTFSNSSFLGNMGLCGFPIDKHCDDTDEKRASSHGEQSFGKEEIEWVYVSAALGFGLGFGGIIWLLFGCESINMRFTEKVEIILELQYRKKRCRRSIQRNNVRRQ